MLDELEIVKQLRGYGYSIKHASPLVHQSITKITMSSHLPTQEEVIEDVITFHPILGFEKLAQS